MTLKHILCAVDFSDCSQHALDYAVALARAHGAKLSVLHVLPPVPSLIPAPDVGLYPPFVYTDDDLARVRLELARFILRSGGDMADPLLAEGPVVREILQRIESLQPQLVVVGTHGRSGFERLLVGSVAERVLVKAPCPVLTVPIRATAVPPPDRNPFAHVLCAVDFSPASLDALALAGTLAVGPDARITVLHVVEPAPIVDPVVMGGPGVPDYTQVAIDVSRSRLHECVVHELGRREGVIEQVTSGKPYREITRVAHEHQANVIVMGVHGGVRGLVAYGSTTMKVVRTASCPVLTVKS